MTAKKRRIADYEMTEIENKWYGVLKGKRLEPGMPSKTAARFIIRQEVTGVPPPPNSAAATDAQKKEGGVKTVKERSDAKVAKKDMTAEQRETAKLSGYKPIHITDGRMFCDGCMRSYYKFPAKDECPEGHTARALKLAAISTTSLDVAS